MKPDVAFTALQKQELAHKFVEIGKVLLTWAILKNVDMVSLTLFNYSFDRKRFVSGGTKSRFST